jgi:hypothetical protein
MTSEHETNGREVLARFSGSRSQYCSILFADRTFGHTVIACICVGFSVVDKMAWVGGQVCASYKLNTEGESLFPGNG